MGTLRLDRDSGTLRIRTTVEGRASRMGHRLTIDIADWNAAVELTGLQPTTVELTADLTSLQVISGDGGVTPVSPVDKAAIKHNALKSVHADDFPVVTFAADSCAPTADGFELQGDLTINNHTSAHPVRVVVSETDSGWKVSGRSAVVQTEFSIKPYSLMVGALRVGDEVSVEFQASFDRSAITG